MKSYIIRIELDETDPLTAIKISANMELQSTLAGGVLCIFIDKLKT